MNTVINAPTSNSSKMLVPQLSAMMFLQFFVWGAWYVTLGIVMSNHGLVKAIGDAYSLGPIACILSPFVLGMLVDRFFASQRVVAALHALGAVLMFLLPSYFLAGEGEQQTVLWIIFAYMLCYMPTIALTNNIAFHSLSKYGGEFSDKYFPIVRVLGTIGWIAAGLLAGNLGISETTGIFTLTGGASLLLAVFSLTLPNTPPPAKGKPLSFRDLFCADAFSLLFRQGHFVIFVICATLISIPLAAYYAYAGSFVMANHIENVASVMTLGQMSEIVFMLLIPFFFVRLGIKRMLLIGMLAWCLRYAFFALGITESTRWMIYAGIILHGICYDFFFVIGFIYTDKVADAKIKGQAQSLITLFTYGLGMLIGSQISGALFNRTVTAEGDAALPQWQTLWWYPSIAALLIAVVFFLTFHYKGAPTNQEAADGQK